MYTEEFKVIVKELYPDSPLIHEWVESGDWKLGSLLNKHCDYEIDHQWIIAADSLTVLQEASALLQARKDLYQRWLDGRPNVTVGCTQQVQCAKRPEGCMDKPIGGH